MKISIEWLREFVEVDASTDELIDVFPMLGMEVEGYYQRLCELADLLK